MLSRATIADIQITYRRNRARDNRRLLGITPVIDIRLQPGNYTAIVWGNNNGTGNALVEFYELPLRFL